MPSRARSAAAPLYLLVCLVLGAKTTSIWEDALLQLGGIALIGWAAGTRSFQPMARPAKQLLILLVASIVIITLQLVPLPGLLWDGEIRERIIAGYRILGAAPPALAISLAPYQSFSSLLCLIPPLGMFLAIIRLKAYRPSWLVAALVCGTLAVIAINALTGTTRNSDGNGYPAASLLVLTGPFSPDHVAIIFLMALPFLAAAAGRSRSTGGHWARSVILAALALLMVVDLALNRSIAAYFLTFPVLAASTLIVLPRGKLRRGIGGALAALFLIFVGLSIASSSIGRGVIVRSSGPSLRSREAVLTTTAKAIGHFMPLGSGLGSFAKVYRLYESPDTIASEPVVHAYNDYAEIALELGGAGVLLMLLFLGWWGRAVFTLWQKGAAHPFARAAAIGSAVVLVDSLVDFPLRTAAVSAAFAMCVALLADLRQPQAREAREIRPARHIAFD